MTRVHLAYEYAHLAIIEILIKDARLNLNIQNNFGTTSFHLACLYEYLAV